MDNVAETHLKADLAEQKGRQRARMRDWLFHLKVAKSALVNGQRVEIANERISSIIRKIEKELANER